MVKTGRRERRGPRGWVRWALLAAGLWLVLGGPVPGLTPERQPAVAAAAYGEELVSTLGRPPVLDLVLLGIAMASLQAPARAEHAAPAPPQSARHSHSDAG